jgi:ferritin-like metal-binding protein YciE
MRMHSFHDLYENQLQDLYYAEKQNKKALSKMIKKASSMELQGALEDHLDVTQQQIDRLEKVFEVSGLKPKTAKCEGIDGIIEEADEVVSQLDQASVRDAGIIASVQRVEHYEIAGYGTARTFAEMMGHDEAANLLQQTLDEEKEIDQKLNRIAMDTVNREALEVGEEEEIVGAGAGRGGRSRGMRSSSRTRTRQGQRGTRAAARATGRRARGGGAAVRFQGRTR